jgi:hypothetical protein
VERERIERQRAEEQENRYITDCHKGTCFDNHGKAYDKVWEGRNPRNEQCEIVSGAAHCW